MNLYKYRLAAHYLGILPTFVLAQLCAPESPEALTQIESRAMLIATNTHRGHLYLQPATPTALGAIVTLSPEAH